MKGEIVTTQKETVFQNKKTITTIETTTMICDFCHTSTSLFIPQCSICGKDVCHACSKGSIYCPECWKTTVVPATIKSTVEYKEIETVSGFEEENYNHYFLSFEDSKLQHILRKLKDKKVVVTIHAVD